MLEGQLFQCVDVLARRWGLVFDEERHADATRTLPGPRWVRSGYYYYTNANRKEEVQIKLVTADDDKTTDVVIQGDTEEVERFWKTLDLKEKGMVFVEGIISS